MVNKKCILLNQCFYITSCGINQNVDCNDSTILYVLSFNQYSRITDSYYINYYPVILNVPPTPISGICNKIINNQFICAFNDNSQFILKFSDQKLTIGRCDIVTPNLVGNYCIINIKLYCAFYNENEKQKNNLESLKIT
jgi:hypothetical protein